MLQCSAVTAYFFYLDIKWCHKYVYCEVYQTITKYFTFGIHVAMAFSNVDSIGIFCVGFMSFAESVPSLVFVWGV